MQVDISVYYYDSRTARTRMASANQRYIPVNTNSQLTFTLDVAEDKPYEIEMVYTGLEPAECATRFGGGYRPTLTVLQASSLLMANCDTMAPGQDGKGLSPFSSTNKILY